MQPVDLFTVPTTHPCKEHWRSGVPGRGCRHSLSQGHLFPVGSTDACGGVCCGACVSGFARAVLVTMVSLQCHVLEGSRVLISAKPKPLQGVKVLHAH